jgi:hypothetical protein
MAANGISTLPNKADRKAAKIALAAAKRSEEYTVGYRPYNVYVGRVAPELGRPWALQISGGLAGIFVGGLATTTIFNQDPLDGGSGPDVPREDVDGGAAVFV